MMMNGSIRWLLKTLAAGGWCPAWALEVRYRFWKPYEPGFDCAIGLPTGDIS